MTNGTDLDAGRLDLVDALQDADDLRNLHSLDARWPTPDAKYVAHLTARQLLDFQDVVRRAVDRQTREGGRRPLPDDAAITLLQISLLLPEPTLSDYSDWLAAREGLANARALVDAGDAGAAHGPGRPGVAS